MSSYLLSESFIRSADNSRFRVENVTNKGLGVRVLSKVVDRNIMCYFPIEVMRLDGSSTDFAYSMRLLTPGGKFMRWHYGNLPSDDKAPHVDGIWRKKPVIGHFINEPHAGECVNCKIKFPRMSTPRLGSLLYVAIIATRDIEPGEELLLDYGPEYERSLYPSKLSSEMYLKSA